VYTLDTLFLNRDLGKMPNKPIAKKRNISLYVATIKIKIVNRGFRRVVLHILNRYT
jgi:hypothetical protein